MDQPYASSIDIKTDLKSDENFAGITKAFIYTSGVVLITFGAFTTYAYTNTDLGNIVNQYLKNKLLS